MFAGTYSYMLKQNVYNGCTPTNYFPICVGDLYLNTSPATRFYQHDEPQELECVRFRLEVIVDDETRFRLEVIVDDETDQGRFVIFDREARKLTNMLAEDLITFKGTTPTYASLKGLPSCLQELIGKKYIFQLNLTKFDFKAKEKTFSVSGIMSGPISSQAKLPNKKRISIERTNTRNNSDKKGKKLKLEDEAIAIKGTKRQSGRTKRMHRRHC
ncbi:unnamed protein product [Arabis nemorensis]|uniref:Replication factor A C-terminal domain-containing protein n=1 Tax=Arabis nemorensis TaxID=586526 RepID=A0A565BJP8_9BRAS|nr:unnamed protein product [Arabis nemorensis]